MSKPITFKLFCPVFYTGVKDVWRLFSQGLQQHALNVTQHCDETTSESNSLKI